MSTIGCDQFKFSSHAIARMFARGIDTAEVTKAVGNGEVIMTYPDDTPLPSVLLLGYARGRPLHVVLARNPAGVCQIITAYEPDPTIWNDDFKTRRTS